MRFPILISWLFIIGSAWALIHPGIVFAEETHQSVPTQDIHGALEESEIVVHYFDDPLCSVCAQQKEYMEELTKERSNLRVYTYSISDTDTFHRLANEHGVSDYRIMAPSSFIHGELLQFSNFGEHEKQTLVRAIEGEEMADESTLHLPFLGTKIDTSTWSLPILAITLGALDGFNVCSLGALILILSIVLAFNSRKKIFLFGGIFILTTVFVYGGLVFVWGKLIDAFIGQLGALRLLVGLAAIGGSAWFFKEFWRFYKHGPTCESSNSKLARTSSQRMISAFNDSNKGPLMLGGVIVLFAIAITVVELPCSIGVPIAFTGILVESGVSLGMYSLYIGIYLLFYMLIEIIIFTGAVLTKEIWFAGSNIITWTTFTGAVILLGLGVYYLLSLAG